MCKRGDKYLSDGAPGEKYLQAGGCTVASLRSITPSSLSISSFVPCAPVSAQGHGLALDLIRFGVCAALALLEAVGVHDFMCCDVLVCVVILRTSASLILWCCHR